MVEPRSTRLERRDETIHARLKRETAAIHREVERALPLVSPELSLPRYRRVLELMYGFYAPHEAQMGALASRLPFAWRSRAPLLARDLSALGASSHEVATLPRCSAPPCVRMEELAGRLYVFEGASLGGQLIARALRDNLGLDTESGAGFFTGNAGATAARWRAVLSWLEELSRRPAAPVAIAASARATFQRFSDWMRRLDG